MFGGTCDEDVHIGLSPGTQCPAGADVLLIAEPVSEGILPKDLLGKTGERWRKKCWDGGCLGEGSIRTL